MARARALRETLARFPDEDFVVEAMGEQARPESESALLAALAAGKQTVDISFRSADGEVAGRPWIKPFLRHSFSVL